MKLVKSSYNKMLTGVCGGIADYFNIDPTIIRAVTAVSAFFSFGTTAIIYLILTFVMPNDHF